MTTEQNIDALLKKATPQQLKKAMVDLVNRSHKRFKQELVGENDDFLDRGLRQYRSRVARNAWRTSQKWCMWNNDGPVLMPDFCRCFYRKGKTEILVMEQPPQIRLVKLKGSLALRNSDEEHHTPNDEKIYSYSLALPYVVFIFKFVDGKFVQVKCAFSDRPLKRLEERPMKPYLSNIDNTLKVCLGGGFDLTRLEEGNLVQQVAYVLDHFWHSAYSNEWSGNFWTYKHLFHTEEPRLATMQAWQDASAENPLFVIEDVEWLKHEEENFGDIVVRLFDEDMANHGLQEELFESLTETYLDEVKTKLLENASAVEQKLLNSCEEQTLKDLVEVLS